jgi:hypothetical protein
MATYCLEFGEFYEMNPSVRADCSGLVVGTNYCRSTYPGGKDVGIPGWSSSELEDDFPPPTSTQVVSRAPSSTKTKVITSETGTKGTELSSLQTGILES